MLTFLLGCIVGGIAVAAIELWPLLVPTSLPAERDFTDWRDACAAWANERRSEIVYATWEGDIE